MEYNNNSILYLKKNPKKLIHNNFFFPSTLYTALRNRKFLKIFDENLLSSNLPDFNQLIEIQWTLHVCLYTSF